MSVFHAFAAARSAPNGHTARSLLEMLAQVTDPRDPRGVRHPMVAVLGVAVVATLAGARNYRELGSQAGDLPQDLLALLGARWCVRRRRFHAPSGGTLRRVLIGLDAAELDARVGAWLRCHADCDEGGWLIALDGKTLRGSWNERGQLALFSAMTHREGTVGGVVVGQVAVPAGTNEITQVGPLLEPMDIEGALITADAAHTSEDTARYIVANKKADYLLTIKGNRPQLQAAAITACRTVIGAPPRHVAEQRAHGRINRWSTWTASAKGIDFPHAAQLACIRRDVLDLNRQPISKEIALVVTSRSADHADAAALSRHTRGHWGIENLEHRARDVVWREDDHQAYAGNGPQAMATLRNLGISLIRLNGITKITETVQAIGRDRRRAIPLIAT